MTTSVELLRRSVDRFGELVDRVGERWDAPSPCAGWTARDVVGHVIAILHASAATARDERAPMHPIKEPGRHVGDDPSATWASAVRTIDQAIDAPGNLARTITMYRGRMPFAELLRYNAADITIHVWDLARTIGADEALEPELVDNALEIYGPIADEIRSPIGFGDAVEPPDAASPQQRLLALVGRNYWSGKT